MKKIAIVFPLMTAFNANAARDFSQMEGFKFIAIIEHVLMAYLTYSFLLAAIKLILDNRIKKDMIEKGVSEEVLKRFVYINKNDVKNDSLKWFFLLISTGAGIYLVTLFPVGILSIAIIATSISIGFLISFFYLKYFDNKQE